MFYHASPVKGIKILEPRISNHGIPLVYFSSKRENALVYLSNAVEKYCRETGFRHEGKWTKWASYGFTKDKILQLDEYYPNATERTYKGVPGYIYSAELPEGAKAAKDIPFAFTSDKPVKTVKCEYIPDAYEAIMDAAEKGLIVVRKYGEMNEREMEWLKKSITEEYKSSSLQDEYRYFLEGNFPFLKENERC